ncbi:MAG TPA: response regulator [Bacteroidota bacterium]|nr:response regulator [Bacteroidota bacterium]
MQTSRASYHSEEGTQTHGTILIVEDEELLRPLIESFLQEHGFTIYAAESSAKAFLLFLQHKEVLDAAIVDVDWPIADRIALIHAMRLLKPQMEFVCVADCFDATMKNHLQQEGVHLTLLRPYSPHDLLEAIHKACDKPRHENNLSS